MTNELFEELLEEGESERVDFKEFLYDFWNSDKKKKEESRASFIKDVFSFANTPRVPFESAYIIFGVKDDGELVGITPPSKDTIFQDQLNLQIIGKVPRIHYQNFKYQNKNFVIIEILVPEEKEPYIPEIDFTDKVKKGILYLRRDNKNAEANEEEKKKAYQYFHSLDANYKKNLYSEIPIGKELTNFPAIDSKNFIGRKEELKEIKALFQNHHSIGIVGLGGQGKTTFARAFVSRNKSKYNHIFYMESGNNFRSAFVANPTLITNLGLTEEFEKISKLNENFRKEFLFNEDEKNRDRSYYDLVMNKLRELPGFNLLVLDDVSKEFFSEIDLLPKDNWHILFTSRSSIANSSIFFLELECLKEEDAKALFQKYYRDEVKAEELNEFLKLVENHALLIELTAKTLSESFEIDSLGEFLRKLKVNMQDEAINLPVATTHSRNKEVEFYKYIEQIFTITKFELEEPYLLVTLRLLLNFPSAYYEAKEIINILESETLSRNTIGKALRMLFQKGWIQEASEKKGSFKIHQVIRMSLSSQLEKKESDCNQLIEKLFELVIIKENKNIYQVDLIMHLAEINPSFKENFKHVQLLQKSIEIYCNLNAYEKAILCGDFLERNNLMNHTVFISRGLAFFIKNNYSRAIDDHTQAIQLDPKHADTYSHRGLIYHFQKDYLKAIEDYTQAIQLDPKHAVAYDGRGNAYRLQKEYQKAIEDYNQAIELNPRFTWAIFSRGKAYFALKDYNKTIENDTQLIELDPKLASALDVYSRRGQAYLNQKEYLKAIDNYTLAIEIDPKDLRFYGNRGRAYYNLKDYPMAIKDYSQVIQLDPKDTLAYKYRGDAYYNLKDYPMAIEDYTQGIELDKKFVLAYSNRGQSYQNLKEYQKAIDDFNQAIQINPEDISNYLYKIEAYFLLKQYDIALDICNKLIVQNSPEAIHIIYGYRAFIYFILNDYLDAISDLNKSLELDINKEFNDSIYTLLSLTYFIISETTLAIEFLNKAFSLNPTDPTILSGLWFCAFAHVPERREEAKLKLQELIAENIQNNGENSFLSEDSDFSQNIKKAIHDGHLEPELLKEFAKKITGKG